MGMGMGMGMGGMQRSFSPMQANQQPIQTQDKGKGRMVELDDTDWETQFAQLETDQTAGQEGDLD